MLKDIGAHSVCSQFHGCHPCCDTDNSALWKGIYQLGASLSCPAHLLQKMEAVQDDGN